MAEDMARALGAGDPEPLIIAGVECHPRALAMRELAELERLCLSDYRKSYIKTFSENLEYLPEANANAYMEKKIEEASKFDLHTLPVKYSYDPTKIPVTAALAGWLDTNLDGYSEPVKNETEKQKEQRIQLLAATAIESGLLAEEDCQIMVGKPLKKSKVPYVSWWVSTTFSGRMAMAWMAFSKCGITREQFEDALGNDPRLLANAARRIQALTVPSVGNG